MALSLADLNGKPRLRTMELDLGDGLIFVLHEFPSGVFREVYEKVATSKISPTENMLYVLAIQYIEGYQCNPSDAQIAQFKETLGEGTIAKILRAGTAFNRGDDNIAGAAKKS